MTLLEFFANHTYRTVFLGTVIIGIAAGALGTFAYLRKQSLISDVISHSALPGALGAFLVAVVLFEADGRTMLGLIIGAVISGTIAATFANFVSRASKIRIDTAMAIAVATFFGIGMLLMRIISKGPYRGKGGIQDYLFGNASVMTLADVRTSAIVGALALAVMLLCWKEFAVRSFDPGHATAIGISARTIDAIMSATITVAIVIGVKAVGLVLMVAFVVTPPAAARQWVRTLRGMVLLSSIIGGLGSGVGVYLSILWGGRVPTGPVVVLTLFTVFLFSMIFAPGRSLVTRAFVRSRARRALIASRTHQPASAVVKETA